jgi:alpha-L-rhamnosidase
MAQWVDGILAVNPDHLWRERRANDYGDWLSVGEESSKELIGSAYLARSIELTSRAAEVLGEEADARRYKELLEVARSSFVAAYMDGDGLREPTQTACVLALHFDLVPEPLRPRVADQLVERIAAVDGHLATGFLGVEHLLPVLDRAGQLDLAYRLLLNRTYPSWGYSIDQGATSIWERWDGWTHDKGFQDPKMNSFNHYSLGSVGAWLFNRLLGIDLEPDVPGFAQFRIWPQPGGGITWARGRQDTVRGVISADWRIADGEFHLTVDVPVNTTAVVHQPGPAGEVHNVPAGHHEFTWRLASAVPEAGVTA